MSKNILNVLKSETDYLLLESVKTDQLNKNNLLFHSPIKIITCKSFANVNHCLEQINYYLKKGYYIAGFLSYELGYFFEEKLQHLYLNNDFPLIWMGVYKKPILIPKQYHSSQNNFCITNSGLNISLLKYKNNLNKIKKYILNGDTYQVNYTTKYNFDFTGDIFSFYNSLKKQQPVSYSALINFNNNYMLSLSPELFFRLNSKNISVRPMKGTADKNHPKNWLNQNEKNKSENLMIVDLLRNDLGKICKNGSVNTKKLFKIEDYKTLWQMTSVIEGKLKNNIGIIDIIKNLFPSGSVTGAPKIRTMQIIKELEKENRNVYTGAIGYVSSRNKAVFNVAIRTIYLKKDKISNYKGEMGIGSGIVYDSIPKNEYKECLLKAEFLTSQVPDFSLIETMLCENGKINNLTLHLKRLMNSSRFFSIPIDKNKIEKIILEHISSLKGLYKIRLLLNLSGNISIQKHSLLKYGAKNNNKIILSKFKTNSSNIFLYHKTTNRKLYDNEYNKFVSNGYFDVIFQNEKNEITEGAVSNIFIKRKGKYYTPPLTCGILNGIYRQLFMKKNKAIEKILFLNDLKNADEIFLTNAVRGISIVNLE